ncbi:MULTISPECIES: hypothetical protein [unclassified Streptomyces]|uniref:hypothetical protein n=1 Tax=unclassified Streptomyces TaxID=2593676 RepID=UPI0037FCF853
MARHPLLLGRPLPSGGNETSGIAAALTEAVAAANDAALFALIERARTSGQDAGVATVLTLALVRDPPPGRRLPDGARDVGALTHTRPQDLAAATPGGQATGPSSVMVRPRL